MSENGEALELVEMYLMGIPLELQVRSSEHQEGLRREFRMLVEQGQADSSSVPGRLVALAADLDRRFQSFGASGRADMEAAIARGDASVDLVFAVPRAIGPAVREFGRMLEEADEYCLAGEHLLTLTTPPDIVEFRNWALEELINQAEGAPPIPWPVYKARLHATESPAG